MPAVKVAEDQSKLADFQNSDFISAENRKVEFNNPTLEFTHRTARVTIELKPGTGSVSYTHQMCIRDRPITGSSAFSMTPVLTTAVPISNGFPFSPTGLSHSGWDADC